MDGALIDCPFNISSDRSSGIKEALFGKKVCFGSLPDRRFSTCSLPLSSLYSFPSLHSSVLFFVQKWLKDSQIRSYICTKTGSDFGNLGSFIQPQGADHHPLTSNDSFCVSTHFPINPKIFQVTAHSGLLIITFAAPLSLVLSCYSNFDVITKNVHATVDRES